MYQSRTQIIIISNENSSWSCSVNSREITIQWFFFLKWNSKSVQDFSKWHFGILDAIEIFKSNLSLTYLNTYFGFALVFSHFSKNNIITQRCVSEFPLDSYWTVSFRSIEPHWLSARNLPSYIFSPNHSGEMFSKSIRLTSCSNNGYFQLTIKFF